MGAKDKNNRKPELLPEDGEKKALLRQLEELRIDYRALQDEVDLAPFLLRPIYGQWREETGRNDENPPWWEVLEWAIEKLQPYGC